VIIAAFVLSGCAAEAGKPPTAAMVGPCRDIALRRTADVDTMAIFDKEDLGSLLAWNYRDCVVAHEKYDAIYGTGPTTEAGQ
jgi:hypothetical protein